jgi:hypothetical protein
LGLPVAAGLLASLLFLSLARLGANGAVLSFLAPLPLMAVGLGLGQRMVWIAIAVATIAVGMAGLPMAGMFLMVTGAPVLVVVNRGLLWRTTPDGAVEWYPAGRVVAWLIVAVLLLFAAMLLAAPHHDGGIRGWIAQSVNHTLDVMGSAMPAKERQTAAKLLAAVLPALTMGMWLAMAVTTAAIAQAVLERLGRARRPSPTVAELVPPDWIVPMLGTALAAWAVTSGDVAFFAANVVAVALFPFALLGVATTHRAIGAVPGLVLLYGTLFLFLGWALIPAAALGLVVFAKTWVARRQPGGGKEE